MTSPAEHPPAPTAEALARTMDASAAPSTAGPGPLVTQRFGRFTVLRLLGEGGMGMVFAAYDEVLDRRVAVKLLRQLQEEAGTHRQRVLREAQAMARVVHENVIHVYEVGEISGQIFIAMEFIDGTTLTAWQSKEKRTWQELLFVYRQAAQGLLAAHQTGLVHRDFKPDNVLVDRDGRARVVDFGLARLQGDSPVGSEVPTGSPQSALQSPLTRDGAIAGTLGYMSPEQACGAVVDARSDQFSFCVALYEALYGRAPFANQNVADAINPGKPLPPPAHSPVPLEVFAALSRGMAVEPTDRFPSIAELLRTLFPSSAQEGAVAKTWRQVSTVIGVLLVLGCTIFLVLKRTHGTLRLEDLIGLSVFIFTTIALVTFVRRRRLRNNAEHTELEVRSLSFAATSICIRSIGLFLHLDIKTIIPIELAATGGVATVFASARLSPVWAGALCFEGAAVAAALWPQYDILISMLAYSVFVGSIYYTWARAARRPEPTEISKAVTR